MKAVDRVKDGAKRLLRPKDQDFTTETTTEIQPYIEDVERGESVEYNERMDNMGMLHHMLDQINMNKVNGYYNFFYWEREDVYLHDCEEFANRMEILLSEEDEEDWPSDEFRKDIIVAQRGRDEVERGRAILTACQKLMRRRKMGPPEKNQPSEYEPDEVRLTRREYPRDDDGDDDHSDEDDAPHT